MKELQFRKYQTAHDREITSVTLSIATSKDVLDWSHGEVTKPETINYKSFKPEREGLFDELIFGPTTDYKCPICGQKYKGASDNQVCEKTAECKKLKPEILPKKARRSRMGHIHLASPVVHFWFLKIDHSILAKVLNLQVEGSSRTYTREKIEDIVYFKSHIVLENGGLSELPRNEIIEINRAAVIYRNALTQLIERFSPSSFEYEDIKEQIIEIEQIASSKIGQDYGIDFYVPNELLEEYTQPRNEDGTFVPKEVWVKWTNEDWKYIDEKTGRINKNLKTEMSEKEWNERFYRPAKIGTGATAIEYVLQNFGVREIFTKDEEVNNFFILHKDGWTDKKAYQKELKIVREKGIKEEIRKTKISINRITKDLKDNKSKNKSEISFSKANNRAKLYKRLQLLNGFLTTHLDLDTMIIHELPVIPADMRPLIQIDGGRHSSSDINDLYRRIIIRNNRLKNWLAEEGTPMLIVQNELRMLQEAVDALIDNARKKSPVTSKDNRPLKSIADALVGKKGRFRQNLLGKRVDYSGRSVIVVGPNLKMHQVGIPRQMAAKLFEPWIVRALIAQGITASIKGAKKLIEEQNNKIWPSVEKVIEGKLVLLNRAPTLHRLSIQAFEPVLVRGKAIMLHPLVTTAFNADFDGDQMAVHVPISPEAEREARELMLASRNILGPKDGEPIINPSQDIVLGIFYLTKEVQNAKGEGHVYYSISEMQKAYENKHIDLHARVAIPAQNVGKRNWQFDEEHYVVSTVGKFIFNQSFPSTFPFIFDNTDETLETNYTKYTVPFGTDIKSFIKKMPINKPLTKKDLAKVIRKVYDDYVSIISKEDLAAVIKTINSGNYTNDMLFSALKNRDGNKININHALTLSNIAVLHFNNMNKAITKSNEGVERTFESEERVVLLEKIWFDYTNVVAKVLDSIKKLGFDYSTESGTTMSIKDIIASPIKRDEIKLGDAYVAKQKDFYNKGLLTDNERFTLVVKKWQEIRGKIQDDLKKQTELEEHNNNPIFNMMLSGARGNILNFVQLAGMRGIMSNSNKITASFAKVTAQTGTSSAAAKEGDKKTSKKDKDSSFTAGQQNEIAEVAIKRQRQVSEVPVKSSFLDGLTAYEFFSSTPGARKGLTDIARNTANSGYLTRKLVDVAQNIVVKVDDCMSEEGFIVKTIIDSKTGSTIIPLKDRIIGRFTNRPVKKGDTIIVEENTLINDAIAKKIIDKGIEEVEIRSVLGCQVKNGVCKKCYGKDLSTNRLVELGEPVGIVAAQSIGEPGTQLTMRTFHTGGVAGSAAGEFTGGFYRLKQLIDASTIIWGNEAIISKGKGKVIKIEDYKNELGDDWKRVIVKSTAEHKSEEHYEARADRRIRVTEGDEVVPGKKIFDGIIPLTSLLEVAGVRSVQMYMFKEIQRIYRAQGINVADKYIEIVIRQMLSKVLIKDAGDSKFFVGSLVDMHAYREQNAALILKGQKPAYGDVVIKGGTQVPLLSESFLAAASYQETAKVLLRTAISGQHDKLEGLKENVILGRKIPAGTGANYEPKGKFDLKDPMTFFE